MALNERIERTIIEICFHMNGGVTWEEAWGMSCTQRHAVIDYVNKMNKTDDTPEQM